VAYKIFVDAYFERNFATLQKMCEKNFFHRIKQDYQYLDEGPHRLHQVYPTKMQMGCTLIDTKTIKGAYIDRGKNQVQGIVTKFDRKDSIAYFHKYQLGFLKITDPVPLFRGIRMITKKRTFWPI
jgi:hypothetical protein